jgi:hypothetical protein
MKMKFKQETIIAALVSLLLGIVLGGAAGSEGLFGTAVDTENDSEAIEVNPSRFYLVKYEDAKAWLISNGEDQAVIEASITDLDTLSTALDLSQFVGREGSINTVLFSLQDSLLRDASDTNAAAVTTCLGVDSDPYTLTGPGLYVYVEVPDGVQLPNGLNGTELDGEKESSITWAANCVTGQTNKDEEDK